MEETPATYVAAVLIALRDEGIEFDEAWSRAMRNLPRLPIEHREDRKAWIKALTKTRPIFEREYSAPERLAA